MSHEDTGDKSHQWGEPIICMSYEDTLANTHQWGEPMETTFTLESFVCHMKTP